METFDAIVIGAGEAGVEVAARAIEDGRRVALIYKSPYGSTCLNTGCVPSKFLIARARTAHLCRTSGGHHVHAGPVEVDLAAIVREKDELIRAHREEMLQNAQTIDGLTLIEGEARFAGPHEVEVARRHLRSDRIFIATGMRPDIPSLRGLDDVPFLTSDTVMDLQTVPDHLVIIGGGYVACELGQAFRRFGAGVTIIQRTARLCGREEPAISQLLESAFAEEEITTWLEHRPVAVERVADGVRVVAEGPAGRQRTVEGTHLLVAAGRRPNTDQLQLDSAGIRTDKGGSIAVNDSLETTAQGVWAIGDVNGLQPFTRVCQEEAKIAYVTAFQNGRQRIDRRALGHAVFTDPEIGSVGPLEREARERHEITTATVEFEQVARAQLNGVTRGTINVVADRQTRRLLGCHIIGPQAAELVYDAALVIRHEGSVDDLARTVGTFPTLQEGVEGTARALLRTMDSEAARGPFTAALTHRKEVTAVQQPKEKGQKIRCPMCGAEFATQSEMDRHAQNVHPKK